MYYFSVYILLYLVPTSNTVGRYSIGIVLYYTQYILIDVCGFKCLIDVWYLIYIEMSYIRSYAHILCPAHAKIFFFHFKTHP